MVKKVLTTWLLTSWLLAGSLTIVASGCSGCASWKSTTYKTSGSVVITADAAMQGWALYVKSGQATQIQELAVRRAYDKYQAAMLMVIDAGKIATTSGNKSQLEIGVAAAAAALVDLVNLINSFTSKKPSP